MIEAREVTASLGDFALRSVSFTVPAGSYGVVIGPAGSGKTTLLETIAGVIPLRGGRILLDGADTGGIPPENRRIGFVYQHGYLFPHLTVEKNIAYGAANADAAREAASIVGADGLVARDVRGLSGGERQLVAIARAIATRPRLLLLDEPFGALDPRRRALVRRAVRAFQRRSGITVLQVTHDFTEAGLLGDVAILLDAGRVLQFGPPDQLFRQPASPYIAEFLGAENVLAGTLGGLDEQTSEPRAIEFRSGELVIHALGDAAPGSAYAVIRADEIVVSLHPQVTSARNQFAGRISEISTLGALTRVTVDVNGTPLVAALTTRSAGELSLRSGGDVFVSFKAMAVHLC